MVCSASCSEAGEDGQYRVPITMVVTMVHTDSGLQGIQALRTTPTHVY